MKYRLVVFDFDGTLADSFPWFLGVLDDVADRYGFRRVQPAEVESLRGLAAREVIDRLGVPLWKVPSIARHMRRRLAGELSSVGLFPGVPGMLAALHAEGVQLAIVSSNAPANVQHVLGPQAAARIAFYECGASIFGKTRRFQRVLRRSGVPAARAICIGDEIRDAHAARAAGMSFGAVAWGYTSPAALAATTPEEAFQSTEDILRVVLA